MRRSRRPIPSDVVAVVLAEADAAVADARRKGHAPDDLAWWCDGGVLAWGAREYLWLVLGPLDGGYRVHVAIVGEQDELPTIVATTTGAIG